MKKTIIKVLIIAISSFLCLIFYSCKAHKIDDKEVLDTKVDAIDEELLKFVDGYQAADYETYNQPAKINGLKFDKVYIIGKYVGEVFEDAGNISSFLIDAEQNKWYLRVDSIKADNKQVYDNLIGRQVCICGVYTGQLLKEPLPVIGVNKICDIETKEVITSEYYKDYIGDFDEEGKIITSEYNDKDNTIVDFHSIQVGVPFNYKELVLDDTKGIFLVGKDALFTIIYKKSDLTNSINNYGLYKKLEENLMRESEVKLQLSPLNIAGINLIKSEDDYGKKRVYNKFEVQTLNGEKLSGNNTFLIKNNGIYCITLLCDINSKFNREGDYNKIISNIKRWEPPRMVRSTGVEKLLATEEDISNNTVVNKLLLGTINSDEQYNDKNEQIIDTKSNSSNIDNANEWKREELAGIVFKVPRYFDVRKENYDDYYDVAFYPKTTRANATLGFKVIKSDVTSDTVKKSKDNIVSNWKKSYNDLKIDEKTINGNYILIGKPRINGGEAKFAAIANDITKKLIFVIITIDSDDKTNNNYLKDFDAMINGINFKSSVSGTQSNNSGKSNSSKSNNSISSGIDNSVNDYKTSIDKAKEDLNKEVDQAASEMKKELGIFGNMAGDYIDTYTDMYKDIIDKSADIYKNTADDYGDLYKGMFEKYGW